MTPTLFLRYVTHNITTGLYSVSVHTLVYWDFILFVLFCNSSDLHSYTFFITLDFLGLTIHTLSKTTALNYLIKGLELPGLEIHWLCVPII